MNWIFTPAFCKSGMLEEFLEHVYKNPTNLKGFKHVILDQHYPVDQKQNQKHIRQLCDLYDCIYVDSLYDRGLHKGLNNAMGILGVDTARDTFIGCDPDDRPSDGAFQAIRDVMQADPGVAVCGLNFHVIEDRQKNNPDAYVFHTLAGHHVWTHRGVEMWNIAGFNLHLVREAGGFTQPNNYYGGIEVALYHRWAPHGMRLVYLINHTSEACQVDRTNPIIFDKSYGDWKIAHATKGYAGSYGDYIKEFGN